jgi:hypothetical protein
MNQQIVGTGETNVGSVDENKSRTFPVQGEMRAKFVLEIMRLFKFQIIFVLGKFVDATRAAAPEASRNCAKCTSASAYGKFAASELYARK